LKGVDTGKNEERGLWGGYEGAVRPERCADKMERCKK